MEVEIFALCDAATNHGGRLNILGAFDVLKITKEPIVMPPCSIAAKLRFMSLEAGTKDIKIQFIDADGKEVFPTVQASLEVTASPNGTSAAAVLVVRIQQLKLASAGEYSIGLAVDGRLERTIPLYVQKLETKGQQGKSR